MAIDAQGNYFAALPDEKRGGLSGGLEIGRGSGAPNASTKITLAYIDSSTGDYYVNINGTVGGWVLVTGGSGGSSAITHGTGSPIANAVSVITFKFYIDETDNVNPSIWAVSNGVWRQIIA